MKSLTRTISIIAIILISISFDLSPSQKVTETSKNLNECTCQCEYGKNNGLATSFFRNNCFEKDETFHKENNFTCFFEQSCSSTQAIFQTNENINRSIDFSTNPVSTMTILPGGSIAFGSYDKIQIRDLKNEEISKIDRLLYWISSFAVLNDNYSLASASKNGLIRIWDMRNLNIFRDIKINNRTIHSLAVLTDDLLASAYEDKKIRILNLNKNKKIKIITLDGHDDEVFCLAVLPNGLLASGSFDKTIRIWNVTEQKTITKLEGHHNVVSSLAVLAKNLLASASWDKSIRIWDLNSRTAINILYGHTHRLTCLVVLPNGLIASSSWDKTIRIWNVTRKKETKIIYGKNGGINALAVFDDSSLISSSFDKKINVWEKQTILDELNFTCLFEEDSSCANGTIYQGSESEVNMLLTDQNASITCLLVLSDGLLASAYANGNIFIWNLTSRKYTSLNTSHNDTITSLIDLSNGLLASASWDRSIKIWNLTLKEEINSFDNKESAYFSKEAYVSITFLTKLSNGLLASASFKSLKIWNITRREMKEFEIKSFSFVNSLVALNDNASIVIASDDKTIEIVNIRNQTKIDLVGHTDGVTCLLVLSDTLLASGSYDKTVKIWENFKIHKTFNHNYYVTSLALLPDGLLASGSFKEIIIWDIKNEITVQTLIGHSNFVNSLVVLSNGLLASAASENKIIIWKIKPIKSNQSVVLSILCCLIVIFLVVVLISGILKFLYPVKYSK
jgi:WD40 repeat protein